MCTLYLAVRPNRHTECLSRNILCPCRTEVPSKEVIGELQSPTSVAQHQRALQLGVQAVLPANDDALELRDLTPESDLDSPLSSAEYWATSWGINHFNDWRMDYYIE
jgi:hypothetical protein